MTWSHFFVWTLPQHPTRCQKHFCCLWSKVGPCLASLPCLHVIEFKMKGIAIFSILQSSDQGVLYLLLFFWEVLIWDCMNIRWVLYAHPLPCPTPQIHKSTSVSFFVTWSMETIEKGKYKLFQLSNFCRDPHYSFPVVSTWVSSRCAFALGSIVSKLQSYRVHVLFIATNKPIKSTSNIDALILV